MNKCKDRSVNWAIFSDERGVFSNIKYGWYEKDPEKITPQEFDKLVTDRSVFRLNIGKALLNKAKDDYLKIWNIDFITRENREEYGHMRNISKEKHRSIKG